MIVFDSSTIILLSKVELLDILLKNYNGSVIIPREVEKESTVKGTFDALLIEKRIQQGKIDVVTVGDGKVGKLMGDFNINRGEAEAIVLAARNKRCVLGTDDKNAINACKLLGIPYTTAINMLMRMKEKNLLSKEEVYEKLVGLSKYGRYKKEIIINAKKMLGVK